MLQQTQVATVVPYFERFMAAFPTIDALAAADEHEVLRRWEGLGYYRRARQLHRAARVIVEKHAGRFPRDLEAVLALPGIGRYTAGAIVSIAFDQPAPILEANTVRLFSRLVAYKGDTGSAQGQRLLWQLAEAIVPKRKPGQFNQSLMELGSQICTPREPDCDHCPARSLCNACLRGEQDRIPRLRAKPQIEAVHEAAVVVWRGRKVLLRQRRADERWAGLWDFPRFAVAAKREPALRRELHQRVREHTGLDVQLPKHVATLKHGVTRFRITLDCYQTQSRAGRMKPSDAAWQWVAAQALDSYPLSVTGRKLADMLPDLAPATARQSRRTSPK